MIAQINKNGDLMITASNELEAFALKTWLKQNCDNCTSIMRLNHFIIDISVVEYESTRKATTQFRSVPISRNEKITDLSYAISTRLYDACRVAGIENIGELAKCHETNGFVSASGKRCIDDATAREIETLLSYYTIID